MGSREKGKGLLSPGERKPQGAATAAFKSRRPVTRHRATALIGSHINREPEGKGLAYGEGGRDPSKEGLRIVRIFRSGTGALGDSVFPVLGGPHKQRGEERDPQVLASVPPYCS